MRRELSREHRDVLERTELHTRSGERTERPEVVAIPRQLGELGGRDERERRPRYSMFFFLTVHIEFLHKPQSAPTNMPEVIGDISPYSCHFSHAIPI